MGSSWFKFGRKRTPIEGRCNGVLFLGDPENDIQSKRRRRRWAAVQRKQTKANHIDEQIGECVGMAAKFSDAHSSWQSRSIHAKPKYNVWGFVGCCSILRLVHKIYNCCKDSSGRPLGAVTPAHCATSLMTGASKRFLHCSFEHCGQGFA